MKHAGEWYNFEDQAHPPLEGVSPGVPDLDKAGQLGALPASQPHHCVGVAPCNTHAPARDQAGDQGETWSNRIQNFFGTCTFE